MIIVDIAALWGNESTARSATDEAVWNALNTTGGLIISGYPGVERIDQWARTGAGFHDVAAPIKKALTIAVYEPANPNYYRGYHPRVPGSTFKVNLFDIGPSLPQPGPVLPGIHYMTEPTPWPDEAILPGWRSAMTACYQALNEVSQQLMLSIGRAAGLSDEFIADRFTGEHSTLRFLDYPNVDHDDTGGIAAHRHVDASALSLLWQREPGLQAEGPDGVFYDVPMVSNCLSVHVGTVMEQLTAGKVRATPHRVLGHAGTRRSMGFFLEPALSAAITPVDGKRVHSEVPLDETYAWLLLKTHHGREKYAALIPDPAKAKK